MTNRDIAGQGARGANAVELSDKDLDGVQGAGLASALADKASEVASTVSNAASNGATVVVDAAKSGGMAVGKAIGGATK